MDTATLFLLRGLCAGAAAALIDWSTISLNEGARVPNTLRLEKWVRDDKAPFTICVVAFVIAIRKSRVQIQARGFLVYCFSGKPKLLIAVMIRQVLPGLDQT